MTSRLLDKLRAAGLEHKLETLGDQVAKLTQVVGIPPCAGCKGRIRVLNAAGAGLAAKVRKWAS